MTTASPETDLKLGLIGDNIAQSSAPRLHKAAGRQNDKAVEYRRLVPRALGQSFDELFQSCATSGFDGLNITYPYKEKAAVKVQIDDPLVRAIGAVNTVIFDAEIPHGHNTDYSGFVEAYRTIRKNTLPGPTLLIGTGGVGRAVAFGLIALGGNDIRLVDRDLEKAETMARDLRAQSVDLVVSVHSDAEEAAIGAEGLINCTPVGMVGYDGTPLASEAMAQASWAFDAVYTPIDTEFLKDAAEHGLTIISGWELFFYQGVHAWRLFSGLDVNSDLLRKTLQHQGDAT